MTLLSKTVFICIDCESTGLDAEHDQIIEFAGMRFTLEKSLESMESLIKPTCLIPEESIAIHNITDSMVADKPSITSLLPRITDFIGQDIIVGHGVAFDIALLQNAAARYGQAVPLRANTVIDTLRLARLYGNSPTNSLQELGRHFNIEAKEAHRAMGDVATNVAVFKQLIKNFKTTEQIIERLKKPIKMRNMPLGKHKGRPFGEIPLNYLRWAAQQNFDQDLLFSIRHELNRRKTSTTFSQAANPFGQL